MYQIYTAEQLQKELIELKRQKEELRSKRVSALKKYNDGLNNSSALHNIDRKIEDLERKLQSLL